MDRDAARARRFTLHLPLRYRAVGETRWHEARTENISRSGVLFRPGDREAIAIGEERPDSLRAFRLAGLLDVDTPVEMSFVLPGGPAPAEVVCRGRIVRVVPPHEPEARPAVAATISGYRFVRGAHAAA